MSRFSLVFMGTPEFAVPTLKYLIDSGQEVVAVYTQPPRPAHRGQKETPSPIHQLAERHGIPVFTPTSLKKEDVQQKFKAHGADATIVAAYGLILPRPVLEALPLGCINVHPSKLPRWRGAAPIPRTIMAGDRDTAMTIMQMDEGLDTGDILLMEEFAIPDGATAGELHDRLAAMAGPMVIRALEELKAGTLKSMPQPKEGVTYASKITKEETRIDWNRPAEEVRAHILGLSPWPGAWTECKGEKLKVLNAHALPLPLAGEGRGEGVPHIRPYRWIPPSNLPPQAGGGFIAPGTVLDGRLTTACASGAIRPTLVQRPGKKPMAAEDMLRGYAIPPGTVLG